MLEKLLIILNPSFVNCKRWFDSCREGTLIGLAMKNATLQLLPELKKITVQLHIIFENKEYKRNNIL